MAQTVRTPLSQKLAGRAEKAYQEHKNDETTYGSPEVPAGIEGGIARLVDVKFGEYQAGEHKGEAFFYAAGVVEIPTHHNGIPVAGLRTTFGPEPLCDTPKSRGKYRTFSDHYGRMMNVLAQLGIKREQMVPANLEAIVAALMKKCRTPGDGIWFRFRTWKGKPSPEFPDPRVTHEWNGACPRPEAASPTAPPSRGGYVEDHSVAGEAPPANGQTVQSALAERGVKDALRDQPLVDTRGVNEPVSPGVDATADADAGGNGEDYPDDPMTLADLADAGDVEARKVLARMGRAAGLTDEEMTNADNWGVVAALITGGEQGQGSSGSAEESWEPKKGEVYDYRPLLKDGKTRAGEAVECEVMAVDVERQTLTLRNVKNKRQQWANVAWADLET